MLVRALAGMVLVGVVGCGETPLSTADAAQPSVALDAVADVLTTDVADVLTADVPVKPPWRCERRRPAPVVTPTRCNGAASRCARRLDQVVFPTTHNAMSTRADRFTLPNQERSMSRQLGDGVRGLMIDLHRYQGDAYLCHGPCTIGRRRLAEGLCDIGTFMDEHPEEVVVLILESYIEGPELEGALREAGMLEDLHTQAVGAPWPTLGAMVSSGRRVVILDDNADPTRPWDMAVWDFAQETPFSATTPADLDCRENRGRSGNSLFILNHFLTAPTALPRLADMVNHDPFLVDRARRCRQSRGRLPNFVTVDFYETGDLFAACEALDAEAADVGM
nr:hypothetical protein [Deltaproteobacteria bacterium]